MSYYDIVSTKKLKTAERVAVNKSCLLESTPLYESFETFSPAHANNFKGVIRLFALKLRIRGIKAQLFTRSSSTPQTHTPLDTQLSGFGKLSIHII